MASACAAHPTSPTNDPPHITCPSPVTVSSPSGAPVLVTYGAPLVSDGTPPVTSSCAPGSQTMFSVGTTTVACSASDARRRSASCTFPVTVTVSPRLSATQFVAFGDSMTAGEVVSEGAVPGIHILVVDPAKAYPTLLGQELSARYTAQQVMMANKGESGVKAVDGVNHLPSVLMQGQYDALLLMDGANDLLAAAAAQDQSGMLAAADAMRLMVQIAKARRLQVLLATLPPENPDACCPRRGIGAALVVPYNDRLKQIAAVEGVLLVDVYQAFGGNTTTLVDLDGLHPTPAGYQTIADTFFRTIEQRLELPPGPDPVLVHSRPR